MSGMLRPAQIPRRPPMWLHMPVATGNLAQIIGLVVGAWFLALAAHISAPALPRVALMLLGWLVCGHAISHWAVGRLLGIRFREYGLRGTDHPENYPAGLRALMSVTPFFTVVTEKESMRCASPMAKALMFAAGETSTTVLSLLAAWYAWQSGTPGGLILFIITLIWDIGATITTAIIPRGDYAKALRALRRTA